MGFLRKIKIKPNIDLFIILIYFIVPFLFYFNFINSKGFWAPGDGLVSFMPTRSFLVDSLVSHKLPLWNSYLDLGAPFYADIQSSIFYLPNLVLYSILPFQIAYNYMFLFHLSLAGIFTFYYTKQIGIHWKASFMAGITFMFCGVLNAKLGHVNVLNSIIWTPLILYFYEKFINNRGRKYLVLMSLAFSTQIFAGFIQIAFYSAIILLFYFICSIKRYVSFKKWLIDKFNFSIITLGITSIQIIPVLILAKFVGRTEITYEYFSSFSLSILSFVTALFPNILGVHIPNSPYKLYGYNYFGPGNLTEFALYVGFIPLIFAIIVSIIYVKKDYYVKMWATLAILAIIISLGSSIPLINKFLFHIPGFNMFRVSARFLFCFNLAVAVLFAKQLDFFIKGTNESDNYKRLIKITLIVLITSIVCIIMIRTILNYVLSKTPSIAKVNILNGKTIEDFISIFSFNNNAVCIPISIMVVSLILFILMYKYRNIERKVILYPLLFILLIDLHSFSFYHEKIFVNVKLDNPITNTLQKIIKKDERVWPVLIDNQDTTKISVSPNLNELMKINTINGYVTFLPNTFKEITKFDERGFNSDFSNLLINNKLISSLNTKYIIITNKLNEEINTINKTDYSKKVTLAEQENIVLQESNGKDVSIIQQKVNIKPKTIYKLSIEFKNPLSNTVYLDLYGKDYDNNEQQINAVAGGRKMFSKYFYSGDVVPQDVLLRAFSFAKEKNEISHLSLEEFQESNEQNIIYKKIITDGEYSLYENTNALAKFYSTLSTINNSHNDYSYIINQTDFSKSSVVEGYTNKTFNAASITNIYYEAGDARATINSDKDSFVVFSESFYPGWNAYINGEKTIIYRVNGILQGIEIPPGKNEIEFKYEPNSLFYSFIIFFVTLIYAAYLIIRGKGKIA